MVFPGGMSLSYFVKGYLAVQSNIDFKFHAATTTYLIPLSVHWWVYLLKQLLYYEQVVTRVIHA